MLPAAAARFWARRLEGMTLLAIGFGVISVYVGLLVSFYVNVASGPSIILVAGAIYLISLLLGRRGMVFSRTQPARHRAA